MDCCKVLSWKYNCTINIELEVSIWGYQIAVKLPNQGMVKVKPPGREKEAVRDVLWVPVSPRGLLLSQVKWESFMQCLFIPEIV